MITREQALAFLCEQPAAFARAVGLPKLSDELHNRWMVWMTNSKTDLTILAHRGSFKTSAAALSMALLMLTRPRSNIIFMRKTEDDVIEVLRLVRMILEHPVACSLAKILLGQPLHITRADQHSITTSAYRAMRGAPQLLGVGIGGSLTGKHADYIFTDDIVNIADLTSPAERRHTVRIYQELQNIRNPGGRIVNTATPWHPDDAVHRMPNPHKYSWRDTNLLSADQVRQLRASLDPATFSANYELKCLASSASPVQTPPRFFEDLTLLRGGIVHIDAAYGGADGTALTVLRQADGQILAHGRLWQQSIHTLIEEIRRICETFAAAAVHIETNADKGWAAQLLREAGLPVRAYHESLPKHLKIIGELHRGWPIMMISSQTDPDYLAQVIDYSEDAAHDDAPDSLASALRVLHRGRRFA